MSEPTPVVPLQDGAIPDTAGAAVDQSPPPRTSRWDAAAREREKELLAVLAETD